MRDVLTNLLKLQPQNLIPGVNYIAVFIWLMVVGCSLFSIRSQKFGAIAKIFWGLVVVGIPMVGLLIYCAYCLTKVEFTLFPSFAGAKGAQGPAGPSRGGGKTQKVRSSRLLTSSEKRSPAGRVIDADEYSAGSSNGA